MLFALLLLASMADWVPAHWNSNDPKTLGLVAETPINCLLLEQRFWSADFAGQASARGIATLGVVRPGSNAVESARLALGAKLDGVVLEGDFEPSTVRLVSALLAGAKAVLVELPPRGGLQLNGAAPVVGTYQGIWPGIRTQEDGAVKAAPTGGPWIETNAGLLRFLRAAVDAAIWIDYAPPRRKAFPTTRYLQAICDAAHTGARWIISLDEDFEHRLLEREVSALDAWRRMAAYMKYFEERREWRTFGPYGRLALVQDADSGALLSGSLLDMILVKHTPVRPVPRWKLGGGALQGSKLTVNADPASLSDEQRQALRDFARAGGTLLSGPPGWKFPPIRKDQVTLSEEELKRMDEIWREVRSLVGRSNLGARLFNVSGMLSNLLATPDGRGVVLHLVNYSDYPVESVTVHLLGTWHRARLLSPEAPPRELEVYPIDEGTGVDIPRITVCGTLVLD
ncbi:MAG: hypothetical protein ACFE9C_18575 [Candidatus Hodarchaeota archaeon]